MRFSLISVLLALTVKATWCSPIDRHATSNTRQLYKLLLNFTHDPNKIMFGQHGATLLGAYNGHAPYYLAMEHNGTRGWIFSDAQATNHSPDELCDMKSVTGEYPAIVEFDLGKVKDLDRLTYLIQRAVDRKQVVSVSWHLPSPVSNTSFYVKDDHSGIDVRHSIRQILPGGAKNQQFNTTLDTVADWFKGLKYSNDHQASVIFRPFHEMNGGWFWWGTNSKTQNTVTDYKHLYRFVVYYMRDVKQVHNILYAFSPNKLSSKTDYLRFYPGDDYVDILGLDFYYQQPFHPSFQSFQSGIQVVTDLALQKHKIAALTEIGIQNRGLDAHPNFWVDHVLNPLKTGHGTKKISYMLTWDNFCIKTCEVRVPYHGHPAEGSFMNFYRDPLTVFETHVNHFTSQIIG